LDIHNIEAFPLSIAASSVEKSFSLVEFVNIVYIVQLTFKHFYLRWL